MSWLGNSWPDVFVRLPLVLAVVFFALYVWMLWLLLFRRPSFRTLSGRDRWSVLTATFGVMTVWMFLWILLAYPASILWGKSQLLFSSSPGVAFPREILVTFWAFVLAWPIAVWAAFRIALRRIARPERMLLVSRLFVRVSAAFILAFSLVWMFFHFALAGGHSFDHIIEFGPRNLGAVLEWAQIEPIDYGDGYRARFPVRDHCPLCRLEPFIGRKAAEAWRAKEAEKAARAEARKEARRKRNQDAENALLEESISHAESAEGTEVESHAESAEGAEVESHAESAENVGKKPHAEGAAFAEFAEREGRAGSTSRPV